MSSTLSDAWTLQGSEDLSWGKDLEAEAFQPLTLETLFPFVKKLFAFTTLSDEPLTPALVEVIRRTGAHPFIKTHPIQRVLIHLLFKKMDLPTTPLVPIHSTMPLFQLAELALLYSIAGEKEAAFALAKKIAPLLDLPTLWCKEEEFQEKEAKCSLALFRRSLSLSFDAPPKEVDPYYLAIGAHAATFPEIPLPHKVTYPDLGLTFQKMEHGAAAISLSGERTSLGAFSWKETQVRAFGPQMPPLSNLLSFGLLRLPDSQPIERWTSLFALPDVWLEVKAEMEPHLFSIQTKFLGLSVEKPLFFTFYIKAKKGEIQGKEFFPKTLSRCLGPAQTVRFDGHLEISSNLSTHMELIPLAGEGGFWDADFLLAFGIPPFDASATFQFKF